MRELLEIPRDFDRRRAEGREAVQVLVDGSDTVVQSAAVQLAQMPLDDSPAVAAGRALQRQLGPDGVSPNPISVVAFYNPERRSAINIVPGLIGVILTMTMVLFTGVAIVRERERGNMEMLIATPLSRTELMVGKVLPYAVIGLLQTTVVLALGVWLFQVPVRGGVPVRITLPPEQQLRRVLGLDELASDEELVRLADGEPAHSAAPA